MVISSLITFWHQSTDDDFPSDPKKWMSFLDNKIKQLSISIFLL